MLMSKFSSPRVAIVHYWLVSWRGGEKVLAEFLAMYPDADIYTHVYDPEAVPDWVRRRKIYTTFIGKMPFSRKMYRSYLPLMPAALEALDLQNYDLIISTESGPAKGVIPGSHASHFCYVHSPMRYLWDLRGEYRASASGSARLGMFLFSGRLREWDVISANRVDSFAANSQNVKGRIEKFWRRNSCVINPPVNVDFFRNERPLGDYYIHIGQLVPYKRVDILVSSFNSMKKPLVVIGDGPELRRLRAMAGPTVRVMGPLSTDTMRQYLMEARAFVFAGHEDFGIVVVEAIAAGRPVIAYRRGGAKEIVQEGITGIFFEEQSAASVTEAVARFERIASGFNPLSLAETVRDFGPERFKAQARAWIHGNL